MAPASRSCRWPRPPEPADAGRLAALSRENGRLLLELLELAAAIAAVRGRLELPEADRLELRRQLCPLQVRAWESLARYRANLASIDHSLGLRDLAR